MNTINIEFYFNDIQIITKCIEKYNNIHKTTLQILNFDAGKVLIEVPDDSERFINSVFEIGTWIGAAWMRKNYTITISGWFTILRKRIEVNSKYLSEIYIDFIGENNELHNLNLLKLSDSESRLEAIKPHIKENDYKRIEQLNEFTKRKDWNPKIDYSKYGDELSYIIYKSYLLIFSSSPNVIILESIWSINLPSQ